MANYRHEEEVVVFDATRRSYRKVLSGTDVVQRDAAGQLINSTPIDASSSDDYASDDRVALQTHPLIEWERPEYVRKSRDPASSWPPKASTKLEYIGNANEQKIFCKGLRGPVRGHDRGVPFGRRETRSSNTSGYALNSGSVDAKCHEYIDDDVFLLGNVHIDDHTSDSLRSFVYPKCNEITLLKSSAATLALLAILTVLFCTLTIGIGLLVFSIYSMFTSVR